MNFRLIDAQCDRLGIPHNSIVTGTVSGGFLDNIKLSGAHVGHNLQLTPEQLVQA